MKTEYLVLLFVFMWIVGSVIIYDGRATQPSPAVQFTSWNINATTIISFTFALAYMYFWVWEAVVRRFSDKTFILKLLVVSTIIMGVVMWIFATIPGVI